MRLLNGRIEIPTWAVRLFGVALAVALYIGAYKALSPADRKAVRRAAAGKAIERVLPAAAQGEQMRVTPASVVGGLSAMGEQMRVDDSGAAGLSAMGEQMRVTDSGIAGLDARGEQMRVTGVSGGLAVQGEQMRVGPSKTSECEGDEDCRVRDNDTPVGEWGMKVPGIEQVAEREKIDR